MSVSSFLEERSGRNCELCTASVELSEYAVAPRSGENDDDQVALCPTCLSQINEEQELDIDHWRCLNDSIWSPIPAVQVVSYRMLKRISDQDWTQDLLSMMYMDEPTTEWAKALESDSDIVHKDSNGNVLQNGDTVTLIKDLDVKGANFVAKRGTAVRRISIVMDNPEHIQGKINDQTIIILTKFVKK